MNGGGSEEKFFERKECYLLYVEVIKLGNHHFAKKCKNLFKQASPNDAKKHRVQGFSHSQSFTHKLFIDNEEK